MRLIDADKLTELVRLQLQDALDGATITNMSSFKQKAKDCENFIELIQAAPTVDEAPVVQGEWIGIEFDMFFKCSECGYLTDYRLTKFCPECGAKLR